MSRLGRPLLLTTAGIFAGLHVHSTDAASFDCKKAKAPVEILICLDDALSELDGRMGELYRQAVQTASEADKKAARDVQRDWLKSRLSICKIPSKRGMAEKAAIAARACLTGLYRERVAALQQQLGEGEAPGIDAPSSEQAGDKGTAIETAETPAAVPPLPQVEVAAMEAAEATVETAPVDLGTIMAQIASGTFEPVNFVAEHEGAKALAAGEITAKSFDGADNSATLTIRDVLLCTLRDKEGVSRAAALIGGETVQVEGVVTGLEDKGRAASLMLDPCMLTP